MKKFLKRLLVIAIVMVAMTSVFAPRAMAANGEYSKPECDGVFQDLSCTTLDHAAAFMTLAYEFFVDIFIDIDPATFDYQYVGSPGYALHAAWDGMRVLANIIFVILLFVVVISQVSGIGISNYNIKKMLPRVVAGILLVNLSYVICQGAIDLANIIGSGLGSIFEDLLIDSIPPDVGFSTGTTALSSVVTGVVSALIIRAGGLGSKVTMFLVLGLLTVVVAVAMLFVISVVRQALCILLVVFAPIAFVCYMMPGTKGIYSKWFAMFKAVILAYPICSLIIYGSSYAGAVIYGTWVDMGDYSDLLRNLSFLLIATVPYFFLLSVIMKSLTAAENAVARLNNFMQKNSRGILGRTRLMTDMKRNADQDQQLARAGFRRVKFGQNKGKIVGRRMPQEHAIRNGDNRAVRMGKQAYNAFARANARRQATITAPYLKNKVRIEAEERRANAYRTSLRRMEDKVRSNYYVYDAASHQYVRVSAPLTNRQLRQGIVNGQRIYRVRPGVSNPDMNAGSSDFQQITAGESARVRQTIHQKREESQTKRGEDVAAQARNQDVAAWSAQIRNDNLGVEQVSESIKKMVADPSTMNDTQLNAYISSLVSSGLAGREALETLLRDPNVQGNVQALKTIAKGLTRSELDSIKKKNPILYNKLMALVNDQNGTFNVGDLNNDENFKIKQSQLDSLSPKHLAEMDASAQKRVVDDLLKSVEADAREMNNARVMRAIGLAEGALNDPEVRALMSAEQIQSLEQIAGIRREAVEAESAKTMRSDRAAMDSASAYFGVPNDRIGETFRNDFKNKFLNETVRPGGNAGVIAAVMGGNDTARIEAITKAANAQLDEILRDASRGLNNDQIRVIRDEIMRGVIEDIDKAINNKKQSLMSAREQQELNNGASTDDAKAKANEVGQNFDKQHGGSMLLCDLLAQRINMRSR